MTTTNRSDPEMLASMIRTTERDLRDCESRIHEKAGRIRDEMDRICRSVDDSEGACQPPGDYIRDLTVLIAQRAGLIQAIRRLERIENATPPTEGS